METIKSLNWRYATKKFNPDKKLSIEQLNLITESLKLTASSYGLQPWRFVIVENKALKEKLREHSYNQPQITDCSHLIVLCNKKSIKDEYIDKFVKETAKSKGVEVETLDEFKKMISGAMKRKSDEEFRAWAKNQVFIALGNILTVCAENKIDACPMEGFNNSKYNEILELDKEEIESTVLCAVGFRNESDKYLTVKKMRFDINDIIIKK